MPLRKQTGNMYPFVTHTWNPIKGRCVHDCSYCYMKRFPLGELRLDDRELRTGLGAGNFIFVGSSTDMWAENVPTMWILKVTEKCLALSENTYLFQTKNPGRFAPMKYPNNIVLATTIETNRDYKLSKAPAVAGRVRYLEQLAYFGTRTMVTIEPIVDFDLLELIFLVKSCNPEWVNIGADSQGHNLPEPPASKIQALCDELRSFTVVKLKSNLRRLY